MAKRKTKSAADASPATAATGGRTLRSSGRTLRSNSKGVRLVSLEDKQKSPAKKLKKEKKAEPKDKGKKAAEGEGASGAGAGAGAKDKGKKAADGGASDVADEPEDEDDDPNKTVIVVEHCTKCKSFLKRATQVKDGLENSEVIDVVVKLNPEKPRKGCFEIRQQGGQTFISLLDMKRPFQPMKDLDMDKVISDIVDELSNAG